jgi:hypothetical protein
MQFHMTVQDYDVLSKRNDFAAKMIMIFRMPVKWPSQVIPDDAVHDFCKCAVV